MNAVIALIGPYLIRLISTSVAERIVTAVAQKVFDMIESTLRKRGYQEAADLLDGIEKDVLVSLPDLISLVQHDLLMAPSVAQRARP